MVVNERLAGMVPKRKRMPVKWLLWLGAIQFLACFAMFCFQAIHVYGKDWWDNPHAINFLAAWIPSVLSVLVAFVPDKDLQMKQRVTWRVCVIACGVVYSMVLFHQQVLTDKVNAETNQNLLTAAVTAANQHADAKFGTAQNQVAGVDTKVTGLATKVSGIDAKLDVTTQTLTQTLHKTESDLDTSIGKVSTSPVQEKAHLVFSLWDDTSSPAKPLLYKIIPVDANGNVPIDFTFFNDSETVVENGDLWLDICTSCSFAAEPAGFQKLSGSLESIRHELITLNPGAASQKITILVTPPKGKFLFGIRYACKACGKIAPEQTATIVPLFNGSIPNLSIKPQPLVPAAVQPTKPQ